MLFILFACYVVGVSLDAGMFDDRNKEAKYLDYMKIAYQSNRGLFVFGAFEFDFTSGHATSIDDGRAGRVLKAMSARGLYAHDGNNRAMTGFMMNKTSSERRRGRGINCGRPRPASVRWVTAIHVCSIRSLPISRLTASSTHPRFTETRSSFTWIFFSRSISGIPILSFSTWHQTSTPSRGAITT